jgi:hypothetical protein
MPLSRLHAGLELRLPVTSFTCRFRPSPVATGLKGGGGVKEGGILRACAEML